MELPNTRGMSQFADGGLMGSKPYASSGAYLARMGHYCKGCRYEVKARSGPESCPFNSLYWHFFGAIGTSWEPIPASPPYANWDGQPGRSGRPYWRRRSTICSTWSASLNRQDFMPENCK